LRARGRRKPAARHEHRHRAEIFRRLRESNPRPTTELEYKTPFQLLIAVILSAQATDVGVNKASAGCFPSPAHRSAAQARRRKTQTLYLHYGLFNAKAKNVIATCRILHRTARQ